ncbi:hypothetical protein TSAR_010986 [Trichomalopsis sarcophagae]|uniref:Uncharacterized protein n=1 Tax=Trichomalopsis sarcophagae TaxID=543379 RepID=A0A232EWV6_9HYME|nr:hypothetical protein TSAR_010986 [Trichomalopsis sarcophagae]
MLGQGFPQDIFKETSSTRGFEQSGGLLHCTCKPRIGLAILGSLILASISATAATVGHNEYSAILSTHEPKYVTTIKCYKNKKLTSSSQGLDCD